jgi:hypothetical protein
MGSIPSRQTARKCPFRKLVLDTLLLGFGIKGLLYLVEMCGQSCRLSLKSNNPAE